LVQLLPLISLLDSMLSRTYVLQMLVLCFETSLKWVIGDLCKCWCYVLKQVWNGWLGICANVGVTYWNKFEMDDWGFVQMLVLCIETSLKWVIGDLCKCWCYVLKQVWNGWLGICANVGVTFWNKFEMGDWGFVQMLVLRFETSLKWVIGDFCWVGATTVIEPIDPFPISLHFVATQSIQCLNNTTKIQIVKRKKKINNKLQIK
jgi:hypothetical protein